MRIAIFSLIEWDFVNQRPQAFARQLARRGHEVVYVEPTVVIGEFGEWLEQRRTGEVGMYVAEPGITVAEGTAVLFRDSHRSFYPDAAALAKITVRWLSKLQLDFAIVLSPEYTPALAELGIPCAYDHIDETQYMPGVDTEAYVDAMEKLKSLALFNIYIQEPAARKDPKGFFLPNGIDVDTFFPIDRPKLFDGVVLSTIAKWFDMDSVLDAKSRILLIGPMDHDEGDNRKRLFEACRPNIHWIPQVDKPAANLWLSTAKVGIVPFKVSHPVIPYAMPIKILEYFLAGLPVVTYRSEGVEAFYGDRVTYYSPDGNGDPCLDEAIERAQASGTSHGDFARTFTWERLVGELDDRIHRSLREAPALTRRRQPSAPFEVAPTQPSDHGGIGGGAGPVPTATSATAIQKPANLDDPSRRYIARLQQQLQSRTAWAINLNREVTERTAWAQRMERERDEQAEWAKQLQSQLDEQTRWAVTLRRQVKELGGRLVEMPPQPKVQAPPPTSPAPAEAVQRELSFIRQQWWFKLFSPGWRGWLRRIADIRRKTSTEMPTTRA